MLKRMCAILKHPYLFYQMVRDKERMVIFHCACTLMELDKPTVWEVDKIHAMMNEALLNIYRDRPVFAAQREICDKLFWTLLVSRFKQLSVTREDTRRCLELYDNCVSVLPKENVTVEDAVIAHIVMVNKFEHFV